MDDAQQIIEEVKKILASVPPVDQSKKMDELGRYFRNVPIIQPTYSNQPFITEARQLVDPDIYLQFEELTRDYIKDDNQEEALKCRRLLEDLLLPKYPTLRSRQPQLYENYEALIALLKFICLGVRPIGEVDMLIKKYLLQAIINNIDVKNKIDDVLYSNDDALTGGETAFRIGQDILNCNEELGPQSIRQADVDKPLKQTIGNWVRDYLSNSPSSPENQRGSFQQINYIKQNPNILKLSLQDRNIILEVIKIYDWLEYGNYSDNERTELNLSEPPEELKKERDVVKAPAGLPTQVASNFTGELSKTYPQNSSSVPVETQPEVIGKPLSQLANIVDNRQTAVKPPLKTKDIMEMKNRRQAEDRAIEMKLEELKRRADRGSE